MYGISRHVAREPFGVTMLVAAAFDSLSFDTLQAILRSCDTTPTESLAADVVQRHSYRRDMDRILRSAEAITLNTAINLDTVVQSNYVDGGLYVVGQSQLSSLYRIFVLPSDLETFRSTVQQLYRLSTSPYDNSKKRLMEVRSALGSDVAGSYITVTGSIRSLLDEIQQTYLADARNYVAYTALAMHRYRALNGRFPDALDELTPDIIPIIPSDPFDEQRPLKLTKTDNGWVVYSIGPDQQDGHGEPWRAESKLGDVGFEYVERNGAKDATETE